MLDEPLDDGSPFGGAATTFSLVAIGLVAVQIAMPSVAWIPSVLSGFSGVMALVFGVLSLITEASRRGRRQAQLGIVLGLLVLLGQVGWLARDLLVAPTIT